MAVERRTHLADAATHVAEVWCGDPPRGWTPVRAASVFGLVLPRSGVVRAQVDGAEVVLDPASVYVERLGCEQRFAHPRGGDAYTEIVLSEPRVAAMLGGDPEVPEGLVYTTPELALTHRVLLARARGGADAFETAERTAVLAAAVFARLAPARAASGRPASVAARRRLADRAREALAADPCLGLEELGRAVGCSPHHLSRVFAGATGDTLTRYRARLRLVRALDRLGEGERDLGRLAAELGFTDQAHMTHAVRRGSGLTPGRVRALLTGREG